MNLDILNEFNELHCLDPVTPLDLAGKDLAGQTPANRESPKYFGCVYEIICDVDMKNYVGKQKSVKARKAAVIDRYMGSGGPYYQNAIQKHGLEHFHKFYLDVVLYDPKRTDSEMMRELCEKEIKWIAARNHCDRSIGYNLKEGGNGDWSLVSEGNVGRTFVSKGDEQHLVTRGELQYYLDQGFTLGMSEKTKKCMKDHNAIRGVGHSAATRALMSKNSKGKNLGKKRTDELKARQSAMRKGKVWVNDGVTERWVRPDEALSLLAAGWVPGRFGFSEETRAKLRAAHSDKAWANKDGERKLVDKQDLRGLLAEGWNPGRGPNKAKPGAMA